MTGKTLGPDPLSNGRVDLERVEPLNASARGALAQRMCMKVKGACHDGELLKDPFTVRGGGGVAAMSGEQIGRKLEMGSSLKGITHSSREQQGHTIETTSQGGDRDGPNNLVWLHMEFSGAALSALKLRRALMAQLGATGS